MTAHYLRGLGDTNILIYLERLTGDQLPAELLTSTVSLAELSAGVITGAGKGFCAGMDLKAFVTGERPWAGDRGFAGIGYSSRLLLFNALNKILGLRF